MPSNLDIALREFKLQHDGEALLWASEKRLVMSGAKRILNMLSVQPTMARTQIVALVEEVLKTLAILEAMDREQILALFRGTLHTQEPLSAMALADAMGEMKKLQSPMAQQLTQGLGLSPEATDSLFDYYYKGALNQVRREAKEILQFIGSEPPKT